MRGYILYLAHIGLWERTGLGMGTASGKWEMGNGVKRGEFLAQMGGHKWEDRA